MLVILISVCASIVYAQVGEMELSLGVGSLSTVYDNMCRYGTSKLLYWVL
jgi:hypothetical protein